MTDRGPISPYLVFLVCEHATLVHFTLTLFQIKSSRPSPILMPSLYSILIIAHFYLYVEKIVVFQYYLSLFKYYVDQFIHFKNSRFLPHILLFLTTYIHSVIFFWNPSFVLCLAHLVIC
jgi:hypothetical protein